MALALRQISRLLTQRCTTRLSTRTIASRQVSKWDSPAAGLKTSVTFKSQLFQKQIFAEKQSFRFMSSEQSTQEKVADRVMSCLRLYDKIKPDMLTPESHFMKDLGLDSLDHVEIIVAIENEFELQIPDDAAETLLTPNAIVQYICQSPDAAPA